MMGGDGVVAGSAPHTRMVTGRIDIHLDHPSPLILPEPFSLHQRRLGGRSTGHSTRLTVHDNFGVSRFSRIMIGTAYNNSTIKE